VQNCGPPVVELQHSCPAVAFPQPPQLPTEQVLPLVHVVPLATHTPSEQQSAPFVQPLSQQGWPGAPHPPMVPALQTPPSVADSPEAMQRPRAGSKQPPPRQVLPPHGVW
jgi:hypothetical protein